MAARKHEAVAIGPARLRRRRSGGTRSTTHTRPAPDAIGVPGCPLLAACTASIAKVRIVLTANCSTGLSGMMLLLLKPTILGTRIISLRGTDPFRQRRVECSGVD